MRVMVCILCSCQNAECSVVEESPVADLSKSLKTGLFDVKPMVC